MDGVDSRYDDGSEVAFARMDLGATRSDGGSTGDATMGCRYQHLLSGCLFGSGGALN